MPSSTAKKKTRSEDDLKLLHCNVDLEINLEEQTLFGEVEMTVQVQQTTIQGFRFHARQMHIISVDVNGVPVTFGFYNFLDEVVDPVAEPDVRELKSFNVHHKVSVDADNGGSLVVHFPPGFSIEKQLHQEVKIVIRYAVEQPRGGVKFACVKPVEKTVMDTGSMPLAAAGFGGGPELDRSAYATLPERQPRPVHAFTQEQAQGLRCWMPCLDTQSQQCTWTFRYHCKEPNVIVSSGDLVGARRTRRPVHFMKHTTVTHKADAVPADSEVKSEDVAGDKVMREADPQPTGSASADQQRLPVESVASSVDTPMADSADAAPATVAALPSTDIQTQTQSLAVQGTLSDAPSTGEPAAAVSDAAAPQQGGAAASGMEVEIKSELSKEELAPAQNNSEPPTAPTEWQSTVTEIGMELDDLMTYEFELRVPTNPGVIGFACGPFEVLPDPQVAYVTHFCLPGCMPELQHTVAKFHASEKFVEDYVGCSYPYTSYKQVFVDEAYADGMSFAGLSLIDTSVMHSSQVIEQTLVARKLMTSLYVEQWFGCFTTIKSWQDSWLRFGIAGYLRDLFAKKTFGNNESRYSKWKTFEKMALLDNGRPPLYWKGYIHPEQFSDPLFRLKAPIVIGMLVQCVGADDFQKILSAMLHKNVESLTERSQLNTRKFMSQMKKATVGPDIKALEKQWVTGSGCPRGKCAFQYNKKRQQTEFVVRQELPAAERFIGNLCVRINELDGTYDHIVLVDDVLQGYEFTCNSRLRKNRKKKVRFINGDEIIVNLTNRDNPLLWIRVDPQINWGPFLVFHQPMYMWIFQLQMDRDYVAQLLAIDNIASAPTEGGIAALKDALSNGNTVHFHRTRVAAAHALARVNQASDFNTLDDLIKFYKDHFYDTKKVLPLPNDFSDFILYSLKKGLVEAIAEARSKDGKSPMKVLEFLLDILKDNDNSINDYSDYMFIATIIRSLGKLDIEELVVTSTPLILGQISRFLEYEKLIPSFNFEITTSCLQVLCGMQLSGKMAPDLTVFLRYSSYGQHFNVRLEAFSALLTLGIHTPEVIFAVLGLMQDPLEPSRLKYEVAVMWSQLLQAGAIQTSAFQEKNEATLFLCNSLWNCLNSASSSYDARLRMTLTRVYRCIWGHETPRCISTVARKDPFLESLASQAEEMRIERELKSKNKRSASDAGLNDSTIRISLKRQKTGRRKEPEMTPLYGKGQSRIRSTPRRTRRPSKKKTLSDEWTPGGGAAGNDDDFDMEASDGELAVSERPKRTRPKPSPVDDDAPTLSASSSGTLLRIVMKSSTASGPTAPSTSSDLSSAGDADVASLSAPTPVKIEPEQPKTPKIKLRLSGVSLSPVVKTQVGSEPTLVTPSPVGVSAAPSQEASATSVSRPDKVAAASAVATEVSLPKPLAEVKQEVSSALQEAMVKTEPEGTPVRTPKLKLFMSSSSLPPAPQQDEEQDVDVDGEESDFEPADEPDVESDFEMEEVDEVDEDL